MDDPREAHRRVHTGLFDLSFEPPAPPALVSLGKTLFFDPRLSSTGRMSCATCHKPDMAWADGLPRAQGRLADLPRNTPSLFNVHRNLSQDFALDGRARRLEDAIIEAMSNRAEMNRDAASLSTELRRIPGYGQGFLAAYGDGEITQERTAHALAVFLRAEIKLGETPFDRYAKDDTALNPAQRRGLALFVGKGGCLRCHSGPYFSDDSFHRTGLTNGPDGPDPGRYAIEPNPKFWRAFKTPPLRGVALTAPYMHDGRFATLADVVAFYDRGGDDSDHDEEIVELGLTPEEREDLTAFLGALTGPFKRITPPALPPSPADYDVSPVDARK
ncbi:MAG: cytochrome c peroxidase [Elusimicrobiota bacterium]